MTLLCQAAYFKLNTVDVVDKVYYLSKEDPMRYMFEKGNEIDMQPNSMAETKDFHDGFFYL